MTSNILGRVLSARRYVSLRPFDTTTEQGRSAERHRRIALTALLTIGSKLISVATPLITIPLTLGYLGKQQYGLWMTISSITVSLGFADLGIGLGLINAVAECNGREDKKGTQIYVSSAFFLLCGIASIIGLTFALLQRFIPWGILVSNLSKNELTEVPRLLGILVACLLVNMPLGIADRIYLANQEGYISSIFQAIGSFLALICVVAAVKLDLGITGLVLALSGSPILILLLNGIYLFVKREPWLLPRPSLVRRDAIQRLFKLGSMFFVLQICYTLSYNLDNLVIASTIGLGAVAEYVAPARLFSLVGTAIPMLLNPIWPAYVEAAQRGDSRWVKRTLNRAIQTVMLITIPANMALLFLGGFIVRHWTHGEVTPHRPLLMALATWGVIGALGSTTSMFMNAMNVVRYQSIGAFLMAILNLVLSITLCKKIGVSGVVWGSVVAQVLMLVPTSLIIIPSVLSKLKSRSETGPDLALVSE